MLPAVLLLLSLIVLLAVTRHFFSRQHLNMAAHLADYERAYHVAHGALVAGRDLWLRAEDHFNSGDDAAFPKKDTAPPALKNLLGRLLDGTGLPPVAGVRFALDNPELAELVANQKDAVPPTLEVELRLSTPLFDSPAGPGFRFDGRESEYHLFLHATARIGDATCQLTWYRLTRLINILPPVLGKFALFLREQGSLALNRLEDAGQVSDLKDSPLVVANGSALSGAPFPPDQTRDLLDTQGWVFLGGGSRWSLGLSAGGGDPTFADALVPYGIYSYPLAADDPLTGHGKFTYYASPQPLGLALRGTGWRGAFEKCPPRQSDFSSILNLAGTEGSPAPTLVVGNVSRRWALIQGLTNEVTGDQAPFPDLNAAGFGGSSWPGGTSAKAIAIIRENFGGAFDSYEKRMSAVAEEDYNAGLYRLLKLPGDPLANIVIINVDRLPPDCPPPPRSRRLRIDGQPASLGRMAFGSGYSLVNDEGFEIFSGGDFGAIEDLSFLDRRTIKAYGGLAALRKDLPKGRLDAYQLPGVVRIDAPLTIAEPLLFGNGGMLLVRGPIRIQSSVAVVGPDEPLCLVSLSGDIRVETSTPVGAGLIAMKGRVHLPRECCVTGFVAARELVVEASSPPKPRRIAYRNGFDPTSARTWLRNFRLLPVGEEVFLVR